MITDGDTPKPTILSHYVANVDRLRPPFVGRASHSMFDLFLFVGRPGMIFFKFLNIANDVTVSSSHIFRYSEDVSLQLRQVFFRPN